MRTLLPAGFHLQLCDQVTLGNEKDQQQHKAYYLEGIDALQVIIPALESEVARP